MAHFELRWAQLDLARQMETTGFIEDLISLLADSGYNGLLLYLEDRIRTASYPFPAAGEAYSADEIRHIVQYAADRGVEIVPCVATLGHAERFLRHRELEHLAELQGGMKGRFGGTRKQTFCVTHPELYRFLGAYLREVAELFPSRWFHIGLDEFWDYALCPRCKKAMPTREDEGKMFVAHIMKIREIMAQCGKRVMMWSDMFEFYPEAFRMVPRDVVMVDWQYRHDVRGYHGHMLDRDREARLAVNAANGFETVVAPADRTLWNSQSYFEYADGEKGVLGGLLSSWEKNDTFMHRTLPIVVSAGLQMNGMTPDEAFDAMTVKLFGTGDELFRAALKAALNDVSFKHFAGVLESALCTRDYEGLDMAALTACTAMRTVLGSCRKSVASAQGKLCIEDMLDALREKELSLGAKFIVHEILDRGCTAERRRKFAAFRRDLAAYLDRMAERWALLRPGIAPNVFAERRSDLLASLAGLEERLASGAWIGLTATLPDCSGVETVAVAYRAGGQWTDAASGVYKQPDGGAIFCRFIPLKKDFSEPVEAVRLTASGLGGIGINHVEISAGGKRYVPQAVAEVSGLVRDPEYLLEDNTTFAWFGGQSTRRDYFDRAAAEREHAVTLTMREFSVDDIAMERYGKTE